MSFTHLHLHSCYSAQYSIAKINDIVDRVKELGQTSVAITDAGACGLSGTIKFFEICLRNGIKPIIGMELSLIDDISNVNYKKEDEYNNIVLLCENEVGYSNLIKLYNDAIIKHYKWLVIDYSLLNKYKEGLICLSSVSKKSIVSFNEHGNYDEIKEYYLKLSKIFVNDNLFIEIQNHKLSFEYDFNQELIKIGKELGLKLVATNDCHYVLKKDSLAQDIYRCIEECNEDLSDESRFRYETVQYYITSENEMKDLFSFHLDAVYNTKIIADRCKVKIGFVEPYYSQLINSIDNNMDLNDKEILRSMVKKCESKIPFFDLHHGYTNIEYLTKLAMEGIQSRYDLKNNNEIIERLNYELSLIDKNGFTDYFLIIADFVNYAKTNGIPIEIGCGWPVSSLLCYALLITNVDPCKYNLFFDSFVNGESLLISNIWLEISGDQRYELMDYLYKKYGDSRVIHIPSFRKMKFNNLNIDIIGRILKVKNEKIEALVQLLRKANNFEYTLLDLLKLNLDYLPNKNNIENFRKLYNNDDEIKLIIDVANRLDGVVMYRKNIEPNDMIITISNKNNCILPTHKEWVERTNEIGRSSIGEVSWFDIYTIEKIGFVNFALIENKYLDFIKLLINRIKDKKGMSIDIDNISFNDENVYKMLSYGEVGDILNIAYIGSPKGIDFTKRFKPNKFVDLILEYTVFIQNFNKNLDELLKRKNNNKLIEKIDQTYDSILNETYGLIIYQEQIIEILNKLAGYSLISAGKTRRVMAKKKYSEIEKERKRFVYGDKELSINGCIKNGISEDAGNLIFDNMVESAPYAYNKSFAIAKTTLIYISAYFKCYYKKEFIKCHNDYFIKKIRT